jgi:SulP family sulfate permease
MLAVLTHFARICWCVCECVCVLLFKVSDQLLYGLDTGILIGIVSTLVQVIYRSSRPRCVVLGQLDGHAHEFRDRERYSTTVFPGVLVIRFDARLTFYNCNWFVQQVAAFERVQCDAGDTVHTIIVDCEGINELDSTAFLKLTDMVDKYRHKRVRLMWARVKQGMRESLERADAIDNLGGIWLTVHDALEFALCQDKDEALTGSMTGRILDNSRDCQHSVLLSSEQN